MNSWVKYLLIFLLLTPSVNANTHDLKVMIRTDYPRHLSSIQDLMLYILDGTEYQLYIGMNAPDDSLDILRKKIPYQRSHVLMSRKDALLMAVGEQHALIIDRDNYLISVTKVMDYAI